MFGLSFPEMAIVIVVAVLLFGKNLPQRMREFGGWYRNIRKGLSDMQSQLDITKEFYDTPSSSSSSSSSRKSSKRVYDDYDDRDEITAPKFEPPPAEPQPGQSSEAA